MKGKGSVSTAEAVLSLLVLGLYATATALAAVTPEPELLAEVPINEDAGRGNLLIVTLRLESGEKLPLIVDTGAEATIVDNSLEPKLGKRLDRGMLWNFGAKHKCNVSATPKLYLGNMQLKTGDNIYSIDFKHMVSRADLPFVGILGMDCLRYYCLQLDFETGKMRFLNAGPPGTAELGQAFPMTLSGVGASRVLKNVFLSQTTCKNLNEIEGHFS